MDRVRDRQISGICDRFFLSSWDFASESSRRLISFSICIRGEDEMEKEGQRFRVVSSLPTRRLGKTTMVEFVNGQRQRNRVRIDPDPRGVASDGDYARVTRRQSHYCGWYFLFRDRVFLLFVDSSHFSTRVVCENRISGEDARGDYRSDKSAFETLNLGFETGAFLL